MRMPCPQKTPRRESRGVHCSAASRLALVARRHQPQDELEQVDEVEIEAQRAEGGGHRHRARVAADLIIHVLQPLRVERGQAGEHQHADHRDGEASCAECMNMLTTEAMIRPTRPMIRKVPKPGQIALGGVAPQAKRAERGGGNQERLGDRGHAVGNARIDKHDRAHANADQRHDAPVNEVGRGRRRIPHGETGDQQDRQRAEHHRIRQRRGQQV